MQRSMILSLTVVFAACFAGSAQADWAPGEPHKMHFPQLPDEDGWDVASYAFPHDLGDDWQCSASGPVSDIHFWVSFEGHSDEGVPAGVDLNNLTAQIWSNNPSGPNGYSIPDEQLWSLTGGTRTIRNYGSGNQGWDDPFEDSFTLNDHTEYFQINITDIDDPFIQQQGEIYWLVLNFNQVSQDPRMGWKTSQNEFMDAAVFSIASPTNGWGDLLNPQTQDRFDMAFVITPEPSSLVLLAVGGVVLLRRRRA